MPYLRFSGFADEFLHGQLPELVTAFSRAAAVPRDIVKIELLQVKRLTDTPRSLEILMFPRSQEKHDAIARALHGLLSSHGYGETHIFFVPLAPALYYKQGLPLHTVSWLTDSPDTETTP
jgi:hypothetical protein